MQSKENIWFCESRAKKTASTRESVQIEAHQKFMLAFSLRKKKNVIDLIWGTPVLPINIWVLQKCRSRPIFHYLVGIHPHLFIVCNCWFLSCPFLPLRTSSEEDVVYQRVLQQSHEDEDEAAHEVHVNGLHVGDFGEGFSQVGVNGSHGEHRGDTWCRESICLSTDNLTSQIFSFIKWIATITWIPTYFPILSVCVTLLILPTARHLCDQLHAMSALH